MPYKSQAQRKAMNAKCNRGEIKKSVCKEFNAASRGMRLPERVHKKDMEAESMSEEIMKKMKM